MRLFATKDWPLGAIRDRIFAWEGDISPRGQSVPLRLAGALHALQLQGHNGLRPAYPPHVVDDAELWQAVSGVLLEEEGFIADWIASAPQTNEVRRSAALIAVGHWLTAECGLPMRCSELGASGGLNLHWDAYALHVGQAKFGARAPTLTLTPEWTGSLPPKATPVVRSRGGVDLNPLDPTDPADALRLQAYLWPDQPERLAMTRAAMGAATTRVEQGDAIDWLAGRLEHQMNELHLIYSTVAWQYFPAEKQALGTYLIEAAGEKATERTPLAWFGMENDGGERGAALTLRLWPGNRTINLGRADFHGRWIDWTGGTVAH